jgi:hypothetical protein
VISKVRRATRPGNETKVGRASDKPESPYIEHSGTIVGNRDPQRHTTSTVVSEYRPTCRCPQTAPPARPVVYDPFHGSGTTMQVALHMGFDAIGSEANPKYIALSEERIAQRPKCLQPKKPKRPRVKKCKRQQELFAAAGQEP